MKGGMMPARALMMVTLLALCNQNAIAAELSCPNKMEFDGIIIPLAEAEVMNWGRSLGLGDPVQNIGNEHFREIISISAYDRQFPPIYLDCKYGDIYSNKQVVIPVPDYVTECLREGYHTKHTMVITALYCRIPSGKNEDIKQYKTGIINDDTDFIGFHIKMNRDDVESAIIKKGYIIDSINNSGEVTLIMRLPDDQNRYRVVFSNTTNLVREISVLLSRIDNKTHEHTDFSLSIIERFGTPNLNEIQLHDANLTDSWPYSVGEQYIYQVEKWIIGKYPSIQEEYRLVDMSDPKSVLDRTANK